MAVNNMSRRSLAVLIFADDTVKHPTVEKKYQLTMKVAVNESPWSQIAEMLGQIGVDASTCDLEIDVEGALGKKTVEHVLDLAKHGKTTWRIYAASVESAKKATGGAVAVEALALS